MDDIAQIVEEKVNEIYERVMREHVGEHPAQPVDDEVKQIVKQRATSQFMFSLSRLVFAEGSSKKDKIDEWYSAEVQQEIINSCKKCLEEEQKKRAAAGGEQLSAIDRYLQQHGMGKVT